MLFCPGAEVTLDNKTNGSHQATRTGAQGNYEFLQLTPALYVITASKGGFAAQTKEAELLVNQPATISFTMSIQAVQQVVNVSAEAETLNATDAAIGNSVNSTTVENLPMEGRNVPDLLSVQPGVLYLGRGISQTDSRSGAVAGARSESIQHNPGRYRRQRSGKRVCLYIRASFKPLDSVEEFRVITTPIRTRMRAEARARRSQLLPRAGTNEFHGSLYEYNRNTATAANDWV